MEKKAGFGTKGDDKRAEMLNPFVHKVVLDTTFAKIKTAILTVVLLPFRVVVICCLIVTAWFLACIGLYGLSEEDLQAKPMSGWRRSLKPLICVIGKLSYLAGGMAITVRGKQATRAEAPILVIAPHSSFLDSCIVYATKMSSVIVRKESMDNYVGKLINYTQPVYVWRDDPNSRQNTIKEIIERATSKEDWPQVLIFPEGTCTNRSCLITFKPGGFYPGVPVQPVTIRYPNALDTVTWTWEGPGALKLLWLTLTQLHSSCEIEFLPVYHPNEDEKKDPKLFARNVRHVMAKALGIPTMDFTYDDCRLIERAKVLGVPAANHLKWIMELRKALGLDKSRREIDIVKSNSIGRDFLLSYEEFCKKMEMESNAKTQALFQKFCLVHEDHLSWRDYLFCSIFLTLQNVPLAELAEYAFKIYDHSGIGMLTMNDFNDVATKCLGLHEEDAYSVFRQSEKDDGGFVTYDMFIEFAEKKAEYSYVFSMDSVHQKKVKNQ